MVPDEHEAGVDPDPDPAALAEVRLHRREHVLGGRERAVGVVGAAVRRAEHAEQAVPEQLVRRARRAPSGSARPRRRTRSGTSTASRAVERSAKRREAADVDEEDRDHRPLGLDARAHQSTLRRAEPQATRARAAGSRVTTARSSRSSAPRSTSSRSRAPKRSSVRCGVVLAPVEAPVDDAPGCRVRAGRNNAATASVDAATARSEPRDAAQDELEQQHAAHVGAGERGRQRAVDQRAVDHDVDVVEAVPQQRDRYRHRQAQKGE